MSSELLINVTPSETRIALIEKGQLQEVHIEREAKRGIVGNIYKGKISRVLPGMQAAFVDIGLERAAFLHASDIVPHTECVSENEQIQFEVKEISSLVRQGQDIVVQVIKDPLGSKGARLTTDITLPSRYLVFMPGNSHVGVSQKIEDEAERERLKNIVQQYCNEQGGFIVRTVAEGIGAQELESDALFLTRLWSKVLERQKRNIVKTKIYGELNIVQRILRDFISTSEISKVVVDSRETFLNLIDFVNEYMVELQNKIELYQGDKPLFDSYEVESGIHCALERNVSLKSGGYLVFDQTEALTTIDINSGAFVGKRDLEETIFNLNLEATETIAQQLRLRNLGGIIIIDFVDMLVVEHQERVLNALKLALEKDRVKVNVLGFTQLGLVEMTRKRTRDSLEHQLCEPCPTCNVRGTVKTVETVCYEILRELVRVNRVYQADKFTVYAAPRVAKHLIDDEYDALAELKIFINKEVLILPEVLYAQEQFDVVMM